MKTIPKALDDLIEHSSLLAGLEVEFNDGKTSFAVFSPGRVHRYMLHRKFESGSNGVLVFVMLNPSQAGANAADPTWRRCITFAKSSGYKSVMALNLYAAVATDPEELREHDNPVGSRNMHFLFGAANFVRKMNRGTVCVAWGAHKLAKRPGDAFIEELRELGVQPYCLGLAKGGAPRHPLYLLNDAQLEQYHG